MRRTKLIWFALGVATSAVAMLATNLFVQAPAELHPYLSVSERALTVEELDQFEKFAQTSGQLLRECGAKQFFMKQANGPDGVPYSLIKINQENDLAIYCVFERARLEGFPLYIQLITDQNAQVF
ncbi:hypothetical protein [Qipengyuania sp. DGS5-3]|uniref:hypothetical protein n=1 Tax=Qipengyuania sp. DGS5-3 TaxID=3349632 RepID=UPI0036D42B07